jgi:hypothetical protein
MAIKKEAKPKEEKVKKEKVKGEKVKKEKLLDNLTYEMAISILRTLCADKEVRGKLLDLAEAELRTTDADEVAEDVFSALNGLDVVEVWDNSGKTRHGYVEPSELAYTMVEDVIDSFVSDMVKYRNLGMKGEEREFCRGLLRGIVRYENEGSNEFKDWVPDGVMDFVDEIVREYEEHNTEMDTASIKLEIEDI